jgi:hypothetical protein
VPEFSNEGWERDDSVHRTIVLPSDLAERLAAEAGRRGISLSDLLTEYAEQGLRQTPITPRSLHRGLPRVPAMPDGPD